MQKRSSSVVTEHEKEERDRTRAALMRNDSVESWQPEVIRRAPQTEQAPADANGGWFEKGAAVPSNGTCFRKFIKPAISGYRTRPCLETQN